MLPLCATPNPLPLRARGRQAFWGALFRIGHEQRAKILFHQAFPSAIVSCLLLSLWKLVVPFQYIRKAATWAWTSQHHATSQTPAPASMAHLWDPKYRRGQHGSAWSASPPTVLPFLPTCQSFSLLSEQQSSLLHGLCTCSAWNMLPPQACLAKFYSCLMSQLWVTWRGFLCSYATSGPPANLFHGFLPFSLSNSVIHYLRNGLFVTIQQLCVLFTTQSWHTEGLSKYLYNKGRKKQTLLSRKMVKHWSNTTLSPVNMMLFVSSE